MPATLHMIDKQATLKLSGRFTYDEHEQFHAALESLDGKEMRNITIDLREVEFIDSAGLGMLLLLRDRMAATTAISLNGAQEQVRKILQLTRLDTVFNLH